MEAARELAKQPGRQSAALTLALQAVDALSALDPQPPAPPAEGQVGNICIPSVLPAPLWTLPCLASPSPVLAD
jgi:hypothetical protein